jgi:predicted ribosomally synthesized peptide with nif11-like leader
MSTDGVKKFFELTQTDTALMDKVKATVAERGEESSFELVELAAGYDCKFTATELVEHLASGDAGVELSEAELEVVAGGVLDVRGTLGRMAKIISPSLMTKREKEEPDN